MMSFDQIYYVDNEDLNISDLSSIRASLEDEGLSKVSEPQNEEEDLFKDLQELEPGNAELEKYEQEDSVIYVLDAEDGYLFAGDPELLNEHVPGVVHWADKLIDEDYEL